MRKTLTLILLLLLASNAAVAFAAAAPKVKNANGSDIYYPRGTWINLVQRFKVNTVTNGNANADGEIQIWYNGVSAAQITGLRFVRNSELIDKAYFSSFFGGATSEFAPANDSYIWYDDLKVFANRADICELAAGGCFVRTFQAEDYTAMSGVMTEPTPDTGGGLNVGGIDSQDWIAFGNVNIPKTGTYLVEYRVASPNNNGRISLDINEGGTVLGEIGVPKNPGFFVVRKPPDRPENGSLDAVQIASIQV